MLQIGKLSKSDPGIIEFLEVQGYKLVDNLPVKCPSDLIRDAVDNSYIVGPYEYFYRRKDRKLFCVAPSQISDSLRRTLIFAIMANSNENFVEFNGNKPTKQTAKDLRANVKYRIKSLKEPLPDKEALQLVSWFDKDGKVVYTTFIKDLVAFLLGHSTMTAVTELPSELPLELTNGVESKPKPEPENEIILNPEVEVSKNFEPPKPASKPKKGKKPFFIVAFFNWLFHLIGIK